ncbi:urea carboxylase [Roseimicrobium gellanilyticum]|uniref:Urea carboxylase n=1 Tax=Roseimicrobium gellanilyticum TaxID=748857 RepID=A0A366HV41_9BACT|nr:urea carboxylase [Roseimicrobium gellanilyticum]RBP47967.1 urea carboxylase [Roseimicrobium gellanilyticum]
MFSKVLIANRGEIACRVIRTLKKLGVKSVAVYSEADRDAPHVAMADEAYLLGPAQVAASYLNQERLLEVIAESGAQAVHPGYGLLSENAGFAEACEKSGVAFIGPTPAQMRAFGLKHTAREHAIACKVPLVPGTGLLSNAAEAIDEAELIGYPVMLKSTAGGGGIGMRRCDDAESLRNAFESVVRQGTASFGDGGVFIEKFVVNARHIEVQIFGDGFGGVIALGERDCSTQRRNQKVIEETPAPGLDDEKRRNLWDAAVRLAKSVNYRSAGTVEFVYDADTGKFFFLEVNTRLQVEHTVTEEVTGFDLVEWMIRIAAGDDMKIEDIYIARYGCAMQARVYAEDPNKDFQPSCGVLTHVSLPEEYVRCDGWVSAGTEVTPFYDPLLVKIIVHGENREDARARLIAALEASRLAGIETNLAYLKQIAESELFKEGRMTTRALGGFDYRPRTVDVLAAGTMTTVQDYPGRLGYWEVGVPPSGAMDPLSLRMANRLVGNNEEKAGLEITVSGPTLKFNTDSRVALTGAAMPVEVDGVAVESWRPIDIKAGQTLKIGAAKGAGCRAYLAVQGGFDVPLYLGSRSTFTLGNVGGHAGRALRLGDVLALGSINQATEALADEEALSNRAKALANLFSLASRHTPTSGGERLWHLGVLYGPHGAPEFFVPEDMEVFFTTEWEVHYNSARTGVRLIGPKPKWARPDGGEAGLHPSNIHDNAYGVGSVDFTGDMPILLGPDGPSLGGFVCPAVIVQAELWKLGQLKPGDKVCFCKLAEEEARLLQEQQETLIATLKLESPVEPGRTEPEEIPHTTAVLRTITAEGDRPEIVYRPSGDCYLLVEFGPLVLDIQLRFWAHAIYLALVRRDHPDILDLTPGIRSLQIHFDNQDLTLNAVIDLVEEVRQNLPSMDQMEVPSRIVHLPLSWDDPATREAIQKYTQSVRPDAPWCPSNIEFIRRINGLESLDEVQRIVLGASYLVMGLGDVYLGAPVATPLDPRHRLVTTKYNPARTWTPENAVGIGGAYLCIYGMEGPGGYQFVGRTIQMWNRFRVTQSFEKGKPWLLRFFDQVRFYLVSADELQQLRRDFPQGRYTPRIEETTFKLSDYHEFLRREDVSIREFKEKQQRAFDEERQRWAAAGLNVASASETGPIEETADFVLEDGHEAIQSPVNGSLWKLLVAEGDRVESGQTVALVEAMKMEIHVHTPVAGLVSSVLVRESQSVSPGQTLLAIAP